MRLVDRLQQMTTADPNQSLLDFFGVGAGDFRLNRHGLTVGDETISLADAKLAIKGGAIPNDGSKRTVEINDLQ